MSHTLLWHEGDDESNDDNDDYNNDDDDDDDDDDEGHPVLQCWHDGKLESL